MNESSNIDYDEKSNRIFLNKDKSSILVSKNLDNNKLKDYNKSNLSKKITELKEKQLSLQKDNKLLNNSKFIKDKPISKRTVSIKDLCSEEKKKIGDLVMLLAKEKRTNKELVQKYVINDKENFVDIESKNISFVLNANDSLFKEDKIEDFNNKYIVSKKKQVNSENFNEKIICNNDNFSFNCSKINKDNNDISILNNSHYYNYMNDLKNKDLNCLNIIKSSIDNLDKSIINSNITCNSSILKEETPRNINNYSKIANSNNVVNNIDCKNNYIYQNAKRKTMSSKERYYLKIPLNNLKLNLKDRIQDSNSSLNNNNEINAIVTNSLNDKEKSINNCEVNKKNTLSNNLNSKSNKHYKYFEDFDEENIDAYIKNKKYAFNMLKNTNANSEQIETKLDQSYSLCNSESELDNVINVLNKKVLTSNNMHLNTEPSITNFLVFKQNLENNSNKQINKKVCNVINLDQSGYFTNNKCIKNNVVDNYNYNYISDIISVIEDS